MRTSTILATTVSLLSAASARLSGFAIPETVVPGGQVTIYITTENYIQSVQDVAMSFGIAQTPSQKTLGTLIGSKFIGKALSNTLDNVTYHAQIPKNTPKGKATVTATSYSLYGAALSPTLENFQVNITVGDKTSSTYIHSERVYYD
ncbi:hypothetical protein K431DRAFT_287117 [Polychaeton citri CBS 116435]|uniref:Uncharacterized protein n=1 Tax=Polychaeton citri CBS 116435 TaxID=1314669 RepID=A0A9P4Q616_9PEZI|nr:hypothetical protein K431DRAFT_287117 [Polychaeton citri CBS 116435]